MGFLDARPMLTDGLSMLTAMIRWFCSSSCPSGVKVILTIYQSVSASSEQGSVFQRLCVGKGRK